MKTKAILLAAAVLAFFAANLQAGVGYTPATRIAKDPSIPGKGVYGKCLPFAMALQQKLQAAGIPAQVIAYRYENTAEATGAQAGHAIVAFEDGGRIYVMDNQSWKPQWVRNGTPAELARQFSGMGVEVAQAVAINNVAELGNLRVAGLSIPRN